MVKGGSFKLEIVDEQEVPSLLDLIDRAGEVIFETVDGELRPDVLDLYTSALGLYDQRRGTDIPIAICSAPGGPFDLMCREKWTRNDSWLGDWLGWLLYRKPRVELAEYSAIYSLTRSLDRRLELFPQSSRHEFRVLRYCSGRLRIGLRSAFNAREG